MQTDLLLYAIAPTQYTTDASLDTGAMVANAEWMREQGIDRFLLTGAYGEFQSLDDDERVDIARAVVESGAARSVMAGAAHPSTDATVRLARRLFDAGADLVMVSPPMIAELAQPDIDRHFAHIAEVFGGGLVVYNNPIFGTDLDARDLTRLAAMGAYEAVKQGTSRLGQVSHGLVAVRSAGSGDMKILAASDLTAVATLSAGFDGLTSTNCWAFPAAFQGMVDAASKGDLGRMRAISAALDPYAAVVRRLGQPRTVKAALQMRGAAGSAIVRLPYTELSRSERSDLVEAMGAADANLETVDV